MLFMHKHTCTIIQLCSSRHELLTRVGDNLAVKRRVILVLYSKGKDIMDNKKYYYY